MTVFVKSYREKWAPHLLFISISIINHQYIVITYRHDCIFSTLYSLFLISLSLPNYCFKKSNYTRETLVCEILFI